MLHLGREEIDVARHVETRAFPPLRLQDLELACIRREVEFLLRELDVLVAPLRRPFDVGGLVDDGWRVGVVGDAFRRNLRVLLLERLKYTRKQTAMQKFILELIG